MRAFLNNILAFISLTGLTDDEFATVVSVNAVLEQQNYEDLVAIIKSRGVATQALERLKAYYTANGVKVTKLETGSSNIFLGSPL